MRRVRYSVAMSLDGFIAGPGGEHDWITMDPAIDFRAFFSTVDTVLLGRRTFEAAQRQHAGGGGMPGMQTIVLSRTLRPADYPKQIIRSDAAKTIQELKATDGKDIWLMGGGGLFRGLLDAGLVDTIEIAVMPVLLGEGVPLMAGPFERSRLKLATTESLPSGILRLAYHPAAKPLRRTRSS